MKRSALALFGFIIIVAGIVAYSSLFTVDMTQQALVLQFGEPKRVVRDPGLQVKIPVIQNVQYYEKRVLDMDPAAEEVILADQKRLVVDTLARFRIENPLVFFQTVGNEAGARQRLNNVINAATRQVLGQETLRTILSDKRDEIMSSIRNRVNEVATEFGIFITDVRVRRADFPEAISKSVYDRMRSEREREAAELRAQGKEQADGIRADADRQRTVILANAERDSQKERGQGDAKAIDIYAQAFGQDPAFFAFYRSMEAYDRALGGEDTTMVLSPDSDFLRFFKSLSGDIQDGAVVPTGKPVKLDE